MQLALLSLFLLAEIHYLISSKLVKKLLAVELDDELFLNLGIDY